MENWKTTIVGVLMFIIGVVPYVVQALSDLSALLAKVTAVLGGDFTQIAAILPLLMTFIGSLTLIWARDRQTSLVK